jgi:hypothetical protein
LFHPKGLSTLENLEFSTLDFCECPHTPPPRFGKKCSNDSNCGGSPMATMAFNVAWKLMK